MKNALHLICRREDGVSLKGLSFDKATKLYRSGRWDISLAEARSLIGGWVYLHETKAELSEFGGVVQDVEEVIASDRAHSSRVVFVMQKRSEATGQKWRGKDHGMAHSGGLVQASLRHELEDGK